jgi:hypothetical protein
MAIKNKRSTTPGGVSTFHLVCIITFLLVCIFGVLLFRGWELHLRFEDESRRANDVIRENHAQMESAKRTLLAAGCVEDDQAPSGVRCD